MPKLAGPPCERGELIDCPNCPYGGPKCGSRGRMDSPIVFVGEAPGVQEIRPGIPLVGPSGELYWGTLPPIWDVMRDEWGLDPADFLILNALQCLPPRSKNDARKTTEAVKKGGYICNGRLMEQLRRYPRKLVVAMGNHALWSITGDYSYKITQVRGNLIESPLAELGILPIVHPAALLRGTGNYRQYKMDVNYSLDLMRDFGRKVPITPYYLVCDTIEKVKEAIRKLMRYPVLDCDIETTGLNIFQDDILALGVSGDPRLIYIFPGAIRSVDRMIELVAHESWINDSPSMIPKLKEFFRRYRGETKFSHNGRNLGRGKLCWHNGKFDVGFLRQVGMTPDEAYVDEDTMIMSYVLDEQGGIHDLEQVAGDLLGAPDYKYMLKPWLPKRSDSYARVPRQVLYNYLAFDVSNTGQIRRILRRRVSEDPKLEKLYTKLLIPLSETLYWIHWRGMPASRFAAERQQVRLQKIIDKDEELVQVEVARLGIDTYINPGSPQQMGWLLFDKLKLKIPQGMKRSTAKEVLEKLPQIPIIKALREFRNARKFKSTYADTIIEHIESLTGRVHPDLLIHGTRTGRLAHKKIANVPRDKRIRGQYAFDLPHSQSINMRKGEDGKWVVSNDVEIHEANKGRIFIKADLDQAELRCLAALSGDPELCAIYRGSRKLHVEVSNDIWGTPGSSKGKRGGGVMWGEEEYMRAKALNFGIVYGRQAPSIANEFDIAESEAEGYINRWKLKFPVAWKFIEDCRGTPLRMQTIVTPFGRKKRHWVVTRENLIGLQNEASNFPHQSVASDIVVEASNRLAPKLRERDVYIVFLVHDEILTDAPNDLATIRWARELIEDELERAPKTWGITRIPFKADTMIGRRWGIYLSEDHPSLDTGLTWSEYLKSKIHLVHDRDIAAAAVV